MTRKQKYREFLKTDFWIELSARKKAGVKRCQDCKRKERHLQAHHLFYRENWYDTQLEDLVVICRRCHRKRHGFGVSVRFMPYREDQQFNEFIHRTMCLRKMVESGRPLRDRDRRFLEHALRCYPPTKKDGAMAFHVRKTLERKSLYE